ncbi:MAG: hypothetical protein ACR2FU_11750, partial [Streptosporangiaceae bacterium]
PVPRRRPVAAAAALTNQTAGWMVAAALGGSLLTLLLTGQLHSSQLAYVRSAAAQRQVTVSRPAAAGPRRVAVPAPGPASGGARQVPVPAGPGRVVYRRGQVQVVLPPRGFVKAIPAPVQVVLPPRAIRRQLRVLPLPAAACRIVRPAAGGLRFIRVRPGRRLIIPAGRPAAGARASWVRVRGHRIVGLIAPGGPWTARPACFISPARTHMP